MKKVNLASVATLVGYIIGAGVLGIPFIVAKAGFLTGLLTIIFIGIAAIYLNLYTGEIALRTKGSHQLPGYAEKYLGKKGKIILFFFLIICSYSALTAYLLKEGEFLAVLLNPIFSAPPMIFTIIFFILFSILVFIGIKVVEKTELFMVIFFIFIIIILLIISMPAIEYTNLITFDLKNLFLPYGVVLFALFGAPAIPELREELKKKEKTMKKVIIYGSLIPVILYTIFTFFVIGVSGTEVTDGAILGLKNILGPKAFLLGISFGIFTMATSFITVALAVKETFMFDFKLAPNLSSFLACFIPLIAALILINSTIKNVFFEVINFSGSIAISMSAIILVLIYYKAKKIGDRKPEYSIKNNWIGYILILMFIIGIVYKLLEMFQVIKI